jgi:Tfp pilus assembly protein PilW
VTRRDDLGGSLAELLVTMMIMRVAMVVFTASILQMYQVTTKTETATIAQNEIRRAFQRLDKELRYASWLATPGKVGTAWYVEFAAADGTCRQLRVDARKVLQLLRWTPGTPPAIGADGQTLASDIVVDDAVPPFVMTAADVATIDAAGASFAPDYQRLRVRLTATVNGVSTAVDSTFTAANTSRDTLTTHRCSEGRP